VRILDRMMVRQSIPTFFFALAFFVMTIVMMDLFANLTRYIINEVPFASILAVSLLYLPKAVSYALPVALLFAVAYTLGNLYSSNELIAVFGSGVPLHRFVFPLFVIGAVLSVGYFFFEENVVIDTYKRKNELSEQLLGRSTNLSSSNVTRLSPDGTYIYYADYYEDGANRLSNPMILERDEDGRIARRVQGRSAVWVEGAWEITGAQIYRYDGEAVELERSPTFRDPAHDLEPETFRKSLRNVEEMGLGEAREFIRDLQASGIGDYRVALTDYYRRFSFGMIPLIVTFLSSVVGGRLKKNILLMSLLSSLVLSVVYYVAQLVFVLMAKIGVIPPVFGAWGAFMTFSVVSFLLFRYART
jgi:lipopolysaccharide export system permease protein